MFARSFFFGKLQFSFSSNRNYCGALFFWCSRALLFCCCRALLFCCCGALLFCCCGALLFWGFFQNYWVFYLTFRVLTRILTITTLVLIITIFSTSSKSPLKRKEFKFKFKYYNINNIIYAKLPKLT